MDNAQIYTWIVLPLLIFLARVADVTLGTLRIIFVSRGKRRLAPILGFFEVLIWVAAIGQLVQNLGSPASYLSYAAGFAAGNFVGMLIEDRLAIGTMVVRAIVPEGGEKMMQFLGDAGFGVTIVDGQGATGPVKLIYTIVQRKHLKEVVRIIHNVHPKAFLTVEDIRSVEDGVFPLGRHVGEMRLFERSGK